MSEKKNMKKIDLSDIKEEDLMDVNGLLKKIIEKEKDRLLTSDHRSDHRSAHNSGE